MKNATLSAAKGLYDGEETLTALPKEHRDDVARGASVGRDDHAPSHRPDVLRESDINWTLRRPCGCCCLIDLNAGA
ncbi:MAG: hypothetical protein IPO22_23120 [Anaerolineales bacterium]|nr:hypothetical protein [Anaerolineales bacterium]